VSSEYQNENEEHGVRVTDKRRIDPDTYILRDLDAQPESGEVGAPPGGGGPPPPPRRRSLAG
jgi:hypothetical protein